MHFSCRMLAGGINVALALSLALFLWTRPSSRGQRAAVACRRIAVRRGIIFPLEHRGKCGALFCIAFHKGHKLLGAKFAVAPEIEACGHGKLRAIRQLRDRLAHDCFSEGQRHSASLFLPATTLRLLERRPLRHRVLLACVALGRAGSYQSSTRRRPLSTWPVQGESRAPMLLHFPSHSGVLPRPPPRCVTAIALRDIVALPFEPWPALTRQKTGSKRDWRRFSISRRRS